MPIMSPEYSVEFPEHKHIIELRIENFSSCPVLEVEKIEFPASTADSLFGTVWVFSVCPRGKPGSDPNYLGCFLKRAVDKLGPRELHIEFEISVVTFEGVKIFTKSGSEVFIRGAGYGFPCFVKLQEIFSRKEFLLQSDALILRCELRLLPPKVKQISLQTFMSTFPIEQISTEMDLINFQEISKQDPMILNMKVGGFTMEDLLLLKVSMNRDETSEDQVQEGAVGDENAGIPGSYLHMVMVKKKWNRPVHVSCRIKLLNINSIIVIDKEIAHLFTKIKKQEEWVLPHFIDTNSLGHDCIDDGKLYLDFDFKISHGKPDSLLKGEFTPQKFAEDPQERTMMKDLLDLYQTKKFSDVTLGVGDEKFQAHKSVLAARSPKFDEIFTNLLKEGANCENSIVEIGDIDKDTMELVLKFIYTNQLEDLDDERSLPLYIAAQKYQIPSLQFKSLRAFRENLTIKTVCAALRVAEEYKDPDLKMMALDYIVKHDQQILSTPEWQAFTEGHKELSNQAKRHMRLKKEMQLDDWKF